LVVKQTLAVLIQIRGTNHHAYLAKWITYPFIGIAVILIAISAYSSAESTSENFKFTSTQNINGMGLTKSYQTFKTEGLSLKNTANGNGKYNSNATVKLYNNIFSARSDILKTYSLYKIEVADDTKMTYLNLPFNISGTFNSTPMSALFNARIDSRDYECGAYTSINIHEATTLKRNAIIETIKKYRYSGTGVNLTASFNGTGQISILQLNPYRKDAIQLMDANYLGSYSLTEKMALQNASSRDYKNDEAWLPNDSCMCIKSLGMEIQQ
jgi:hypothetical protein